MNIFKKGKIIYKYPVFEVERKLIKSYAEKGKELVLMERVENYFSQRGKNIRNFRVNEEKGKDSLDLGKGKRKGSPTTLKEGERRKKYKRKGVGLIVYKKERRKNKKRRNNKRGRKNFLPGLWIRIRKGSEFIPRW